MTSAGLSGCPGCGVELPGREGPVHSYLPCSPACWALYGEVLAREYENPAYFWVHQLTVDTYAVQHPGASEGRAIRSTALHLITLCLVVEHGADPRDGPRLHRRLAKRSGFVWLDPPRPIGRLTVADVHNADSETAHIRAVHRWARDVWSAWEPHHATVRAWFEDTLGSPPGGWSESPTGVSG